MSYLRTGCRYLILKDQTLVCSKIQRGFLNRGERLIKFEDSWFSMKSIEVECLIQYIKCRGLAERKNNKV